MILTPPLNSIRTGVQLMRLPIPALAILFAALSLAPAQTDKKVLSQAPENHVDRKTEREILKMEDRLRRAVAKRDLGAIDRMLVDYYASSNEGSDRGIPKKATMAGYAKGTIPFYDISEERKLSVRGEFIIIEGISRIKPRAVDTGNEEREVRVKRFWAKKEGRWQVVIQTLQPIEEEPKR
jgi:ketosteroid isomerase-like protein